MAACRRELAGPRVDSHACGENDQSGRSGRLTATRTHAKGACRKAWVRAGFWALARQRRSDCSRSGCWQRPWRCCGSPPKRFGRTRPRTRRSPLSWTCSDYGGRRSICGRRWACRRAWRSQREIRAGTSDTIASPWPWPHRSPPPRGAARKGHRLSMGPGRRIVLWSRSSARRSAMCDVASQNVASGPSPVTITGTGRGSMRRRLNVSGSPNGSPRGWSVCGVRSSILTRR